MVVVIKTMMMMMMSVAVVRWAVVLVHSLENVINKTWDNIHGCSALTNHILSNIRGTEFSKI